MSDETRDALARRVEELAAFLTGEAPLEGVHFGYPAPKARRVGSLATRYWWRSAYLRPLVADLLALLREEREPVACAMCDESTAEMMPLCVPCCDALRKAAASRRSAEHPRPRSPIERMVDEACGYRAEEGENG
jgi:hypothetical protein